MSLDLMLDIETLGRGPGCVVLQVAIVPFHLTGDPLTAEEETEFTFEAHLSIGEQLAEGYAIEPETLSWWMNQKEAVRKHVFSGTTSRLKFKLRFDEYLNYVKDTWKTYTIWASAPKLDFGCLHTLLVGKGEEYPILYSAERDLRTLRETVKMIDSSFKWPRGFNPHNAIDDCKRQIIDAQVAYEFLKTRTPKVSNEQTSKPSTNIYADVRATSAYNALHSSKRDNRPKDSTLAGRAKRILTSSCRQRFGSRSGRSDRSLIRATGGLHIPRYGWATRATL